MLRKTITGLAVLCSGSAVLGQSSDYWFRHWNGPGNHQDSISAIAHGPDGSVSAVGLSRAADGIADIGIVRYASNGTMQWSAVYGNLPARADDARGVGVDGLGNTYALGTSYNGDRNIGGSDYDYVLFKYTPGGQQLWMRRYNGPGNWADQPQDMVVDSAGNCYIAGGACYQPGPTGGYASDFHVIKYTADGTIAWEYHTNSSSQRGGIANAITLDAAGNAYATGYVIEPGANQNFLTVKLAPDGSLVYRAQHSTPGFNTGDDEGLVITADPQGNAYVAGYWRPEVIQGEPDRHLDTLTLKYSSSGELLWDRSTTRVREEAATTITVDFDGNVYVGGAWLGPTETDGWIESYSPNGAFRWQYALDEEGTYDENWIVKLRMGGDGVLNAAADNERPSGYDPTLLKFATDGTLLMRESFDAGSTTDSCFAMDIDAEGNIYFGGNSYFGTAGSDFLVMKILLGGGAQGDLDGDGDVDLADLTTLLADFGCNTAPCNGDVDADGDTDLTDLAVLLANFGT